MNNSSPLLSICIPTYNRIKYLTRLLNSILPEVSQFGNKVEIIINDNASVDNTKETIELMLKDHPSIRYYRNTDNQGADFNISDVFNKAQGRFAWVIGDDDYLLPGALLHIISVLSKHLSTDIVYLNSKTHQDDCYVTKAEQIDYTVIRDKILFASKVGVYFTFISGIIINKVKNNCPQKLILKYKNTSLIQLSWVYNSLKNGNEFIIINSKYVNVQPDNSGGYKFFTVFSKNFSEITGDFFPVTSKINNCIRNSAAFFLLYYIHAKNKGEKFQDFESENYLLVCDDAFKDLRRYRVLLRHLYSNSILSYVLFILIRIARKFFLSIFRLIGDVGKFDAKNGS